MVWNKFSWGTSLYFAPFRIFFLTSLPDQCSCFNSWKTFPLHDAATSLLHVRDERVMRVAHFPTIVMLKIQAKSSVLVSTNQRSGFIGEQSQDHIIAKCEEWKGLKTMREYIDPQIHHYSTFRVPHDDACFLASILVVENNHRYPHNNCRRTPVPCTLPPSPSGLHPWLLVWCKSTTARPSGILTRMLNMILGLITWPENTLDASASQFKHRLHIVSWMSAYPEVC